MAEDQGSLGYGGRERRGTGLWWGGQEAVMGRDGEG